LLFYTTSVVLVLVSIPEFTALILDFQNGDHPPSWILKFSQFLSKIQICAYFYVHMQNLVKIWVIAYFRFSKMVAVRHLGF